MNKSTGIVSKRMCIKMAVRFFCISLILGTISCSKKDEKKILGKWQNEQDWFLYRADKTYDAGKSVVTMVRQFKYTSDPDVHRLTMYTDQQSQSYYLEYTFIGEDTLAVRNSLSTNRDMVKFYRIKE
ncbi:MAG: hypothetical protein IPN26_14665 [Bacteroidetes bacterium]|nr:hypothetical protein [Bacteroidota bacterium]